MDAGKKLGRWPTRAVCGERQTRETDRRLRAHALHLRETQMNIELKTELWATDQLRPYVRKQATLEGDGRTFDQISAARKLAQVQE